MLNLSIGDEVKVRMPRGRNNRGVDGVHLMFTTSPEARFDGSVGTIVDIQARGSHGIPLFLVDFSTHDNPWIPYQAQWFREDWLEPTRKPEVSAQPEDKAVAPPDRTGGPVHQ